MFFRVDTNLLFASEVTDREQIMFASRPYMYRAIGPNRDFEKNRNSVCSVKKKLPDKFWQKVGHSLGDYKNTKTC